MTHDYTIRPRADYEGHTLHQRAGEPERPPHQPAATQPAEPGYGPPPPRGRDNANVRAYTNYWAAGLTLRATGRYPAEPALHGFAQDFAELSLLDMARESLRYNTLPADMPRNDRDTIRAALSGGTFGDALTAAFEAEVVRSFQETSDSTAGWVRETRSENFRDQPRFRLGDAGQLVQLARGGQADHAAPHIADIGSYRIARYAKQLRVGAEDLADDTMQGILQMFGDMGRAAKRLRTDLIWGLLHTNAAQEDGYSIFDAGTRGNLATDALDATGLQAAVTWMAGQTTTAGGLAMPPNIRPRYLIVAPPLFTTAAALLRTLRLDQGEDIILRTEARAGTVGLKDPATGTSYTGAATHWYAFASATQAPAVEVAYLQGISRPTLSTFRLERGEWGMGFAVTLDIGVKVIAPEAAYMSDGTA